MKIIIEEADIEEAEVIIRGRRESREVMELLSRFTKEESITQLSLYSGGKEFYFKPEDISYFNAEGNRITAYVGNKAYEVRKRLYELALMLSSHGFVQISKGMVVNTNHVAYIEIEFNGNYVAFLKDEKTKLIISRKYMRDFRKVIMEGRI